MNDLFLSLIGILFLLHAWTAFKRSALDDTRDSLFDLREEVRRYFLKTEKGLDDPFYTSTRDYINSFIRFTHEARFLKLLYFTMTIKPETQKYFGRIMDKRFETSNRETEKYIKNVRRIAIMILRGYLLKTSSLAMALSLPIGLMCLVSLVTMKISINFAKIKEYCNDNLANQTTFRPCIIEQCAYMSGQ